MYTSQQWRDSESIAFIKSLTRNARIYSNCPDVIRFLAEKESLSIPEKISPLTMEPNHQYKEEIEAMCEDIRNNNAILVYFKLIDWKWFLPTPDEVESICQISILKQLSDGTIYTIINLTTEHK